MRSYEKIRTDFFAVIKDYFRATVATHDLVSVTARTMNIIYYNNCLYCQTDCNSVKFKQLLTNNQVCIAYDNVQILCSCIILGHPFDKDNYEIMQVYSQSFIDAYNKYSHLKQERLLKLVPYMIKIWEYTPEGAEIRILDVKKKEYSYHKLGY